MRRCGFVIICCLMGMFSSLSAQRMQLQRLPYVDQRQIHFGFALGTHTQDMSFTPTGIMTEGGERWFAEIPSFSPGFNVSLLGDLYLHPHINLRFAPGIFFGSKSITFREELSGEEKVFDMRSNYIVTPLEVKFSSKRLNNYRPYAMVGLGASFDISRREGMLLRPEVADLFWEVGFGCDLYLYYFKLIPELKFTFGFSDMLSRERTDLKDPLDIKYTQSIARAVTRMVVLSFYFE